MKYLIVLFLFCNSLIFTQSNGIKGRITDSETGIPLPGASVASEGTARGAVADQEGRFHLAGPIEPGSIVKISYIGYADKEISAAEFSGGELQIRLEPRLISSQTILVKGSIGTEGVTPVAFSKISRESIEENHTFQDIPEYLSTLPSTTFYSEAGNGIGYNYLSIRGFDQRRISVAINGIPQNDPEDHNVYWLDFPDLLSSTELIQVQRGAGAGIIGFPSVGGSINIITNSFSSRPYYQFSAAAGSYNTRKYTAEVSSGPINNGYSIYAKLSKTLSSGYRKSAWSDFSSYYLSAVKYDANLTSQVNFYGGPIADGLAYTGLPKFTIKDRELRKENLSDWGASGNQYDYKVYRRASEIENFSQPHLELMNDWKISPAISLNSALFLVMGDGFFDYDASWADTSYFRLTGENGIYPAGNPSNSLVRAMVSNKQYGWIPRLSFKHSRGELLAGAEIRFHRSLHWGSINFAEGLPQGIDKDFRYYEYNGAKNILNFYLHEDYQLSDKINVLAELQAAFHTYRIYNEKYVGNDFSVSNFFLNPRFGVNYKITPEQNVYVSFARVGREPRLTNYYDAAESSGGTEPQFEKDASGRFDFSRPLIKPETMNDLEAGSAYVTEHFTLNLNLFYMVFQNEIVKKGQTDRFGQPVTGNAESTIHSGVEISGLVRPFENFEAALNGTFSRNYIKSGLNYVKYRLNNTRRIAPIDLSGNTIAGFPDLLLNINLKYAYSGMNIILSGRYSGRSYSDNYGDKLSAYIIQYPGFIDYEDNEVDPYFTANMYFSYQHRITALKSMVKAYFQVNNVFDNLYAAYAIGKEFFPAAERNFTAGLQFEF